jgi:hypothetical protein
MAFALPAKPRAEREAAMHLRANTPRKSGQPSSDGARQITPQ